MAPRSGQIGTIHGIKGRIRLKRIGHFAYDGGLRSNKWEISAISLLGRVVGMSIAISVVVPVRDNWDQLLICLEGLAGQLTPPQFEVIIVDDGSIRKMPASVREWKASFPMKFKRQIALGVSAARNSGIADSTGDVVLFVDSDVLLEPGFLRGLAATVQQHPEDVAFQARLSGGKASLVERMEGLRLTAAQRSLLVPGGYIRYANTSAFAVRRDYVSQFREFFDVSAVRGEDTFVLVRLCREGRLPRFAAESCAQHRPGAKLHRYLLKHFAIGYYTSPARRAARTAGDILLSTSNRSRMLRFLWNEATGALADRLALVLVLFAYAIELCGRATFCVVGMAPDRRKVLSVEVNAVRKPELLARIISTAVRRESLRVTYLTAWTLVQAERDPSFQRMLRGFDLCYADGMGVVLASGIQSLRRIKKVTANDFIMDLCKEAAARRISLGMIGGSPSVMAATRLHLKYEVPELRIAFTSHGYCCPSENERLQEKLSTINPQLILVGMGQPLQEKWVGNMRSLLPNTVFLCVGGLFDAIAQRTPTPHWIIRQSGLEWFYRLVHDPRKYWKRYCIGLPLLALDIVRHQFRRAVFLIRARPATRDSW